MALYFITGVLINSSQGRSGKELIPHHKFWTDLPGLIRVSMLCFVQSTVSGYVAFLALNITNNVLL